MKDKGMKSRSRRQPAGMRAEYDLDYSKAVRGKYHRRLVVEGSNVVVLDPDVALRFRSSAAVNKALRTLLKGTASPRHPAARANGRSRDKRSGAQR